MMVVCFIGQAISARGKKKKIKWSYANTRRHTHFVSSAKMVEELKLPSPDLGRGWSVSARLAAFAASTFFFLFPCDQREREWWRILVVLNTARMITMLIKLHEDNKMKRWMDGWMDR